MSSEDAKRAKVKEERRELVAANSADSVKASRLLLVKNKSKLKADVKRTTGFVKKSRTLSEDNCSNLLADIEKLNLTRYVSELVGAILEAPLKSKDVFPAVKVISAIHQRYNDFTAPLLQAVEEEFLQCSNPNEEADKTNIARVRVLLRLSTELVLCGVVDNPGYCIKMLRRLTRAGMKPPSDRDVAAHALSNLAFSHHQAVILFVRNYADDFLLLGGDVDFECLVPQVLRERTQALVSEYYNSLASRVVKEHVALLRRRVRNKEELVSRGSLSKRSVELLETHEKTLDRLLGVTETLAELLKREVPSLDEEEKNEDTKENTGIALWDRRKEGDGNTEETLEQFIYGGEETRAFYCDLLDLQAMVPLGVLGEAPPQPVQPTEVKAPTKPSTQSQPVSSKGTLDEALGQLGVRVVAPVSAPVAQPTATVEPTAAAEVKAAPKAPAVPATTRKKASYQKSKIDVYDYEEEYDVDDDGDYDFDSKPEKQGAPREVQELLLTLSNCLSRSAVDKFCVEFCHLHSKTAKSWLLKDLRYIPWNRTELIPYYARIAATLSQIHEDIGPRLVHSLVGQFRYLSKTTSMNKLEQRLRNARYLGELVKFNLENLGAPPEKAFFALNKCFKNFAGANISYVCELLETCGRYLYRNPETHADAAKMLDVLWRYRKQLNLSHSVNTVIENAYYFSKATEDESQPVIRKVKSNTQLYLEYLFFDFLGSKAKVEMPENAPNNTSGKSKSKHKNFWSQCNFVIKQLSRLPWNTDFTGTADLVIRAVLKTYKLRASSLSSLCRVLASIAVYYPEFATRLVDTLLERIETGLEKNDYRYQQKRLGEARLFAELYNARLVENVTFFDTLFMMIHHGHATPWAEHTRYQSDSKEDEQRHQEMIVIERERRPRGPVFGGCGQHDANKFDPTVICENDPTDDTFRVRLVCETINSCGAFIRTGALSRRLDHFWTYLEQYVFTKTANVLFTHHLMNDTLQTLRQRPSSKHSRGKNSTQHNIMATKVRPRSLEEARLKVKELERKMLSQTPQQQEEEEEDEPFEYDESYVEDDASSVSSSSSSSSSQHSSDSDSQESDGGSSDQHNMEEEAEAEKEFEREFAQLMQLTQQNTTVGVGGVVAHSGGVKSSANMAIPRHLLLVKGEQQQQQQRPKQGVEFRLLKRGVKGRIETKAMVIPESTRIAQSTKKDVAAERKEHELMKSFVLQYEEREHHARLEESRNQFKENP